MNIELDLLFDVSYSTHNALLDAFGRLVTEPLKTPKKGAR